MMILTVPYESERGEDDEFLEFSEDRDMERVKLAVRMKFSSISIE